MELDKVGVVLEKIGAFKFIRSSRGLYMCRLRAFIVGFRRSGLLPLLFVLSLTCATSFFPLDFAASLLSRCLRRIMRARVPLFF